MKKDLSDKKTDDNIERLIEESVRKDRGIEALVEAIWSEASDEFPMDLQGINYSFGDIEIEGPEGQYIPVRALADHLDRDQYDTPKDLLMGLRKALFKWKGIEIPMSKIAPSEDEFSAEGNKNIIR